MTWWTAGGASGIVAAYEPIGAPDLASSYVNRANPGTYDAAPGVAPTFDTATGWTFNGSTQYLTTGVVPGSGWTWIIRVAAIGSASNGFIFGTSNGSWPSARMGLWGSGGASAVLDRWENGGAATSSASFTAGVAAATTVGYLDGSVHTGSLNAWSGTTPQPIFIGARNSVGSPASYKPGQVAAFAIYSSTLTADQVAAVSTAMAALPTGGSWSGGAVAVILAQMEHHRAVFGG